MSEWKENANKRRDWRHTLWPDEWPRPKRRKNTKKWCKGKEGREHNYKLISDHRFPYHVVNGPSFVAHSTASQCSRCGRKEYTYETWEVTK